MTDHRINLDRHDRNTAATVLTSAAIRARARAVIGRPVDVLELLDTVGLPLGEHAVDVALTALADHLAPTTVTAWADPLDPRQLAAGLDAAAQETTR